jgi:uncharacterized protein (TIGR03084 family)
MKDIINDLIAEQSLVDTLLDGLTEEQWKLPLDGCKPWILQDAVNHIAFFDYAANRLMDHEFKDLLDGLDKEADQDEDYVPRAFRHYTGAETLAWWRAERTKMVFKFMNKDPKERIPWAPGMPMSAKSLCSARLMELWAHSVDIYDALGMDVVVCERIKSVLFLSWQARPFAYSINGFELPETPMYLELTLPSGELWVKGEPNEENYIKGSAKDWAMVAVRRRNWMDTELEVVGEEARRYASVVQTYAGAADAAPEAKRQR